VIVRPTRLENIKSSEESYTYANRLKIKHVEPRPAIVLERVWHLHSEVLLRHFTRCRELWKLGVERACMEDSSERLVCGGAVSRTGATLRHRDHNCEIMDVCLLLGDLRVVYATMC